MNRRDFIKGFSVALAAGPLLLKGIGESLSLPLINQSPFLPFSQGGTIYDLMIAPHSNDAGQFWTVNLFRGLAGRKENQLFGFHDVPGRTIRWTVPARYGLVLPPNGQLLVEADYEIAGQNHGLDIVLTGIDRATEKCGSFLLRQGESWCGDWQFLENPS